MIKVFVAALDATPEATSDAPPNATSGTRRSHDRLDPASVLSADELERAERLRGGILRRRWIASHIALRRALAAELNVPAQSLGFTTDAAGKPHLAGAHAGALEFSLSHSAALAVIAVSRTVPVGADVELIESITDSNAVARRHFSHDEWHALDRLAGDERVEAFYRIWTRKEAYIKATGSGLGHALDRFVVSHARDDARIASIEGDETAARDWTLVDLQLDAPYVGAVAAQVPNARVVITHL